MKFNILSLLALCVVAGNDPSIVPDRYIVKMKQVNRGSFQSQLAEIENVINMSRSAGNGINHHYENSIFGFSAKMDSETLERVKNLPTVAKVSPVRMTKIYKDQPNATWGISRLSTRSKLTTSPYTYRYKENGGEGVTVYVVDTGINIQHEEFEGRASWGTTIVKNVTDVDNNGHGSHCAGTIAGKTYGVAKKAKVVAVKVYDGRTGPDEDVLAGVEWVINNANLTSKNVMSMSIGTDYPDSKESQDVVDAVNRAVDLGIVTAVAAGNDYGADACKLSPARAAKAITVGATTLSDSLSSFSNSGKCISILAPGSNIKSAWNDSKVATNIISGTSMATPHIAGLSAVLLSSGVAPKDVKTTITQQATKNAISEVPADTVNLFAYYQI